MFLLNIYSAFVVYWSFPFNIPGYINWNFALWPKKFFLLIYPGILTGMNEVFSMK